MNFYIRHGNDDTFIVISKSRLGRLEPGKIKERWGALTWRRIGSGRTKESWMRVRHCTESGNGWKETKWRECLLAGEVLIEVSFPTR